MSESATRPLAVKPQTAAEMLDVSRSHIYQLVERGTLTMVNIPGSRAARILVDGIYKAVNLENRETGGDAS